jgi:hypothetical protein
MMQYAARFWGLPETETEANFDPVVSLLMGACATELEKINGEIENSRSRVLERLVQLLSPEALTGVLPAHAIAYALPAEQSVKTLPSDQFYINASGFSKDQPVKDDVYFSPVTDFLLRKVQVKYKATGSKILPADLNNSNPQPVISSSYTSLPQNQLWLGLQANNFNLNGLTFYFDVPQQSQKKHFFNQLPKAEWSALGTNLQHATGYPYKTKHKAYFNADAVLNRDISITEKIEQHIHAFYSHHFITLTHSGTVNSNDAARPELPEELTRVFAEKELAKIQADEIYWICIKFPETIHSNVLEDLVVSTNCFPVVNRRMYDINYRIKDFVNIIPLTSEETFLDIFQVTDQQGRALHLKNDSDSRDEDFSILLRFGGVGRFDKREAAEMVDKLIHLLREEVASFSVLGNDFLQNEMTALQQIINKLQQQITHKHLFKGTTPYLIINNKITETAQTVFVKFWGSNGASANMVKAFTPLNIYSSSQFETGTAKLVTMTQGGRDKLSDGEKVLAYKSALLSKQKLVTNEDIAAFCRLRLAIDDIEITIKKGCEVMQGEEHGLIRMLEVHILPDRNAAAKLLQSGTFSFWQSELETAIAQHSNFFIPVKVLIKQKKN